MKYLFLIACILNAFCSQALTFTGVYSYSKGMNKASGVLYVDQFKEDSAFFFMQGMSGMPDFLTNDLKGFIQIENNIGTYRRKDSCSIDFTFSSNTVTIQENRICKFEFSPQGKYKKTYNVLKKSSSLLPAFSDKQVTIKKDSIFCLSSPHVDAPIKYTLQKNETVSVIDEFSGFLLIEVKNKKNEFLWVLKKNLITPKK